MLSYITGNDEIVMTAGKIRDKDRNAIKEKFAVSLIVVYFKLVFDYFFSLIVHSKI